MGDTMSKLISLFQSFIGDREALVSIVSDGIASAVTVAAVHGTQAPLVEALSFVATLKGTKRAYIALREGVKATGLTISTDGKRVSAQGLTVGKMTKEKGEALGVAMGEAFTLAASAILTAQVDKAELSPSDKADRAFKALSGLTDAQLLKAFNTSTGLDILAALSRAQAAQAQSKALASAKRAVSDTVKAPDTVKAVDTVTA